MNVNSKIRWMSFMVGVWITSGTLAIISAMASNLEGATISLGIFLFAIGYLSGCPSIKELRDIEVLQKSQS